MKKILAIIGAFVLGGLSFIASNAPQMASAYAYN
jgi:hypothetical protein